MKFYNFKNDTLRIETELFYNSKMFFRIIEIILNLNSENWFYGRLLVVTLF